MEKPDGTVAGPAESVPLLSTGNVEQLISIYEQVCRYLCGRQAGDSIVVPVSVNVSRAHLKDTDFVQKVKQLLIRYGVHPSLMEFELTETMLAESMEEAAAVICGLRALGCKVSIDDFGTGYSALNLLKELEFDILKLDGSFVSGAAAEGYKSDVILRNIIRMADELYMTVLCEGLETAGQVERLNTFGCTLAQGYYFAQPMPAEAFEAFVQQAGGYCALPWGGADGAQRLPDYCEASALTDSAVRSITHSLFDTVPCAVAGVDPSSRQLLFANEQLFSLCGYPRGQMAEMEKAFFAHIATEPEKARLYAEMRRQFGTAGRCDTKLPVRRADGSVIWVRMTATYAGSPEWGRYLLCFFYDITREQTGTAAKSREITAF
ncbi:MAG: EAL domain-containing protein [Ruthenibacterium lactatiformans]